MKKKVIGTALLSFTLMLGACGENGETTPAFGDDQPDADEQDEANENEMTEISYEIVTDYDEESIASIKEHKGYKILEESDEQSLIYIGSGEKATGGYGIHVDAVTKEVGKVTIHVNETSPDPDAMVTQALTYPHVVVKLTEPFEEIEVVNPQGEPFEKIEAEA